MRGQSESTKTLIEYARRLLEADHPQTLRQLHYAIFSRDEIDYANDKASYQRLSRATTLARRLHRALQLETPGRSDVLASQASGCIPPEWMIDETRLPETVAKKNPTTIMTSAANIAGPRRCEMFM